MPLLKITCIGTRARHILARSPSGTVWGSTSQGVFIHFPPRELIFLSYGSFRGPLTANLSGEEVVLRKISVGEPVQVVDEKIIFPRSGICLDWSGASIWEAPPLPTEEINLSLSLELYEEVSRRVSASRSMPSIELSLRAKRSNLNLSRESLLSTLVPLLGQGLGLTPAGDDFILGLLLTLRRWEPVLPQFIEFRALSQKLVEQAYLRTTLLSANLIECASEGLADERLTFALDGVMTGNMSMITCVDWLLSWGDSSGSAALAGMGSAMLLI